MKQQPSKARALSVLCEEEESECSGSETSIANIEAFRDDIKENTCEKDEPTTSNEQEARITDETLRLFECMPKGFANCLEFGPLRRVSDAMDYEKMCILHSKKMVYYREKHIPLTCRDRGIREKELELRGHIENFEQMIEEVNRRTKAAEKLYQQCKLLNRELDVELPKTKVMLEKEIRKRDAIIQRVTKYEKFSDFVERILKMSDSQYDSFNAIVDRNSTLILTNKYLMKKYLNRHLVQEKLSEEVQYVRDLERTHSIFLRKQISQLKKELSAQTRANIDLEQKCGSWSETMNDRQLALFNMKMCINNMAENVVTVRPYVARKMEGVTEACDQIHAVGRFMLDYTDIIKKLKLQKKKTSTVHI